MATDDGDPAVAPLRALRRSLSAQLLALTILFVLLAELIVLVPSVSQYRIDWLEKRLEQAYLVGLALEDPDRSMIDPVTMRRLFATAGVIGVIYDTQMGPQKQFSPDYNWMRYRTTLPIDLDRPNAPGRMAGAWATMFSKGDNLIRVAGAPRFAGGARVEMFVSQAALRRDLKRYAVNILWLSLLISTLTAFLFYGAVDHVIVRPVRRLTRGMARFNESPEDAAAVLPLSSREDELGAAERGLRDLEQRVQDLLAQRRRLAALGSGISKISHDLRNILASAQLMSDRLAKSDDPRVRSLSPRLVQALDRAVALSRDTLSYGRMEAAMLRKTRFGLSELVDEAIDDNASGHVDLVNEVATDMTVLADRTQIYRALFNLVRNAVQAIAPEAETVGADGGGGPPELRGSVTIRARNESGRVVVDVADTGPGVPAHAREKLFEPFQGSQKPGGSGLGVAIAHEILKAHGGSLALTKSDASGATFTLVVPN